MIDKNNAADYSGKSLIFEIRIQGHLDERWTDWFDEATILRQENGDTLIICQLIDQAALHGLIKRIRDLGIPLVSINRLR